jgi:hypothetical protein
MSVRQIDISPELQQAGRRFGYGVAVVINVAMLIVVQQILGWGWLPFLTDEFAEVVPWISMSLIASIVANLVYQFNDTTTVKSTGQILVNLISIFVTLQMLLVFPFDFSAYTFSWEIVVRVVLVLAMVGAGVGALTEVIKLVSGEPDKERK